MYLNRVFINGRLTEDPEYRTKRSTVRSEEYCILRCHCEKPIKIKEVKSREDVYFEVHAFGKNAQSIKDKVFQGTPLMFELEIRNIVQGDSRVTVLQAVKIHFHERSAPRRLDSEKQKEEVKSSPQKETIKEEQPKELETAAVAVEEVEEDSPEKREKSKKKKK